MSLVWLCLGIFVSCHIPLSLPPLFPVYFSTISCRLKAKTPKTYIFLKILGWIDSPAIKMQADECFCDFFCSPSFYWWMPWLTLSQSMPDLTSFCLKFSGWKMIDKCVGGYILSIHAEGSERIVNDCAKSRPCRGKESHCGIIKNPQIVSP